MSPRQRLLAALGLFWTLNLPSAAAAIVLEPDRIQVRSALEAGKAAAAARTPPDRLYAWFGSTDELEPRGFLLTKLVGLTVMSAHFALRAAMPTDAEIAQVLAEQSLLISVILFGDQPGFAADSYMVLAQGDRTIKPVKVRFDAQAARTSVWPKPPAYRAKVIASFSYRDFDPLARTRLEVFPSGGGKVSFDLDFSRIE
jgi:hypothetical protein